MCRSIEDPRWRRRGRDRLSIRAFYLRFSVISFSPKKKGAQNKENPLPRSLTLHFLPRISGSPLDINDSPIPSDSSAFLTLHRVTSTKEKEVVFASRERVRASEGVRFEVYWREEKVFKGVFRRKESHYNEGNDYFTGEEWKVDCRCTVEISQVVDLGLGLGLGLLAEVCIVIEGDGDRVIMCEKLEILGIGKNKKKKMMTKKSRGFVELEEIPEEREVDDDNDSVPDDGDSSSSSSCCCCGGGDLEAELRSETSGIEENQGLEVEIEGVRWAVDVGMWAMCLGAGYLLSVASLNTFRRRSFF